MQQRQIKFISVSTWIIAILFLNGVLLLIYSTVNQAVPFWNLVWNYMETDVFKLVTGSLIIPLLFSILEKRYKFMENIQKQREEKQKQTEDLRRKSRQEAIRDTLEMWQELFDLSGEIIFFDKYQTDKRSLSDIIRDLNRFSSSAEHIVNKWTHQFSNLTPEDHDVFLYFINLLYLSDQTAAYYIMDELNDKEVRTIQDALFQIQDEVKTILNHTIADILKYSALLLDSNENPETSVESDRAKKTINELMESLKIWRESLKSLDEKHDNFLSTANGPQVEEVRKTAKELQQWLKEDDSRVVYQWTNFENLEKQYYEIPLEERMAIIRIPYTKEYLLAVSDYLSFESACNYLYNRVHDRW